jgi:2-oxoglutarate ferredoxin oxidoreductase subunit alpha
MKFGINDNRTRYLNRLENQTYFILGDEACAYGALYAGCDFFAGYPITPASEIAELMALELPRAGGFCIQMEDELASMAAIIGASWTGARTMTATSGPGFSLMQENIGYAIMTETPCVVVDVQRSGPSTGQATKPAQGDVQQARWGTHGDHNIIALAPNSAQECFNLMIECFNLADIYRSPVILLMDGEIGHIRESVSMPRLSSISHNTRKPARKGSEVFGGDELVPGLIRRIYKKIEGNRNEIVRVEKDIAKNDNARVGVISYGATARPARGAVRMARENGKKVDFLRLITIWPFARDQVRKFSKNLDIILVPEMNLGQLSREIERFVDCDVVSISKIGGVPHTIKEIYKEIMEFI